MVAVDFDCRAVVVMGVSGCGKSTLAEALAGALGGTMVEGDDFHSTDNRARMQAGVALTDDDRAGWLAALGRELHRLAGTAVLSCSALKREYRQTLRAACPGLRFVFLEITPALALQRVQARSAAYYFNPSLVASQFEALEPPLGESGVLCLSSTLSVEELRDAALRWIRG
jgi:gluconokinase